MILKKIINGLFISAIATVVLTSCDDGHVDDPVYVDTTDSYTVKITGTFKSLHTWSNGYTVDAACFDGESSYSVIQKVLPSTSTDSTVETVVISKVPTTAKTVEIAVMNSIRKRIAALYSYEIPADWKYKDTIDINVGTLNVGVFGAINRFIFQNPAINCAKCHAKDGGAAGLDLTEENAYKSLVGVTSTKDRNYQRIKAYDADNSYIYKVITTGTDSVRFSHMGLLSDYPIFVEIFKNWINSGAKE